MRELGFRFFCERFFLKGATSINENKMYNRKKHEQNNFTFTALNFSFYFNKNNFYSCPFFKKT